MPSSARAIIAAAGSGKTQELADTAISLPSNEPVLLTTYTVNGAREISDRIVQLRGFVPSNITVMPWLSFLLRHGARPYQASALSKNTIRGIHYQSREQALVERGWRPNKSNTRAYYLSSDRVFRDVLSDFVLLCDDTASGAVFRRIAQVFSHVLLDELQDVSGRDFEVIERLMAGSRSFMMVGDPRQCTYLTTQSRTNRAFTGSNIVAWLKKLEKRGELVIDHQAYSHRCHQDICDFADTLFPAMTPTTSRTDYAIKADLGVHLVRTQHVDSYARALSPQLLVWNSRSRTFGLTARNYGAVKGMTFDRVLIVPTGTVAKHLQKGANLEAITRSKFYVAITRARYSVGIVLDAAGTSDLRFWEPEL